MKHTLKAKYAADGLSAHRQRVEATQPAVVARQREAARRQEIVDRVSARFAESSRPRHDNLSTATMFSASILDAMKRQMARDYAKLGAQLASYGTAVRTQDDQPDALAWIPSRFAHEIRRPVKYMAVGAGRPDLLIMDDVQAP